VRVAALYDVHGNLPALEAVLDDVEREGVDAIVCGGDLVSGAFPVEVFERMRALPHTHFVRGNGIVSRSSATPTSAGWASGVPPSSARSASRR
jgi:predicted phosphodiesterase